MSRRGEALGAPAHLVGDRDTRVEPGLIVLGVLACERASDLVQLADVGAAVACASEHVDEGRRPPVVAGKVHEIFRRLLHWGHRCTSAWTSIPRRGAACRISDPAVRALERRDPFHLVLGQREVEHVEVFGHARSVR
jgi:hypothetical protein